MIAQLLAKLKTRTHRHELKEVRSWAMIDGDLVCNRIYICQCGHGESRALLLIATAKQLAEARTRIISTVPNVELG